MVDRQPIESLYEQKQYQHLNIDLFFFLLFFLPVRQKYSNIKDHNKADTRAGED